MGRIIPGLGYTDAGKSIVPGLGYTDSGVSGEPSTFQPAWIKNNTLIGATTVSFKKNTAVTGFTVGLVSATDGSDITTGTVTGKYTLDGGTQGTIAGTITHEGSGQWSVNLTAAEMNGDIVGLTFTHTSAISAHFTIKTVAKLTSELNDFDAANDDVAVVTLTATATDVTNTVNADMVAVSTSSNAANNLELMYDGTGYTDGTAPASRDQVGALTSGSAAISVVTDTALVITTGGTQTNTYTSTTSLDGVVNSLTDSAGNTDAYYEFQVGANGRPVSITWNGYANNNGSSYAVYAYNYGGTAYEQIGNISGAQGSTITEQAFSLTTSHVGTGADLGKVRFRFVSTDGILFATDRILCSYAVVYQSTGYALGAIWVDTNASNTGTTDYVDGVADNPVSTWAAALTLSASLGLKQFQVSAGSAFTLTANSDNYRISAYCATVTLNGQSVSGTQISGSTIIGNDDGSNAVPTNYIDCIMGTSTLGLHTFKLSKLTGNITLAEAGDYMWDYCSSFVAGSGTPDVTFSANANLSLRHYSGGMEINSMATTNKMSFEGDGQFKIAATCTGGAVSLRGSIGPITDASGGAVTLTENARIADDTIEDACDISLTNATNVSADVTQISGSTTAADNLEASALGIHSTTVATAASATEFTLTAGATADDIYIGRIVVVTSGTHAGEASNIVDYVGSTKTVTVTAFTGTLTASDDIVIV